MIQIKNATLTFGKQIIFDNISLIFQANQHIGVVGPNGAGKSTLLKVIDNLMKLDEGKVDIQRGKTIAYMPQELVLNSTKTTFDEAYSVFNKFLDFHKEKDFFEDLLSKNTQIDSEILERYSLVIEELKNFDKYIIEKEINNILDGLGFTQEFKNTSVDKLSLGWRMRLVLAKLLLMKADFYLFDEPTNHLDIVTKEWFFNFLKHAKFGFLLVSHDKYYLENACDYILEITAGKATFYTGNFSTYAAQKEQRNEIINATYERQLKEIEKKQATIERFRASASKAKMAQSMIKKLEKVELIEPEAVLPKVKFKFAPVKKSGTIVLKFENLEKTFDHKTIFKNISGEIQAREKIALVASNGVGKTTLFNVLTGKYKSTTGKIIFGHNVEYAVFEQDQVASLNQNNTIIQEILDACPNTPEATIRTMLGSFLFSNDDIYKKISVLSGGERNRVAMVKVLLSKANFLLLDEPTNHLDIYAKEILLQALDQYDGTILFVSHDHDFLSRLATGIWELTPTKLYNYPGSFESYLYTKNQDNKSLYNKNEDLNIQQSKIINPDSNKDIYNLKKELNSIESKISKLEKEIKKINQDFFIIEFGSKEYEENAKKLKLKQKNLEECLIAWENLQSKLY